MSVNRRDFLKIAGSSVGGLFLAPMAAPPAKRLGQPRAAAENAAGMLYDATICVGCRACQTACKRRADRPLLPELDATQTYEAPKDLSANTWTLIKLYQSADKKEASFVKVQCMHCVEPACVSVCPVGALEKLESGPVIYHEERCFGCRYCMSACPYHIPTYQWDRQLPYIQKCDFCAELQKNGQKPACSEVCPTGALTYGKRGELLDVAQRRLTDNPSKYHNKIYGKDEVGGASKLYLSAVPFEKLGFPTLEAEPLPKITWPYLAGGVPGIVLVMGGLMSAAYLYTHRQPKAKGG